jgi:UDP-2,3-diacylglucosamine hydrolase
LATLFVSDLHLSAERPAIIALFLEFLRGRATRAEALYILGDLFEYWIGDEAVAQDEFRPVIAALRAYTAAGRPIGVLHGNRDFLLGTGFETATGCRLLPEPARIRLGGEDALLLHGDTLCTDDLDYQRFRRQVRDPRWIGEFLAKTVAEREAVVRGLRAASVAAMGAKPAEIMDVNQTAVEDTMRRHGVHRLIHGHTHRPGEHEFTLDGAPARRIVLGDWYEQGSVLVCDGADCALQTLAA